MYNAAKITTQRPTHKEIEKGNGSMEGVGDEGGGYPSVGTLSNVTS